MSEYSKTEHGNDASFVKLREVMDALEVYNDEHSLGSMLGEALASGIDKEGGKAFDARKTKALSNAIKTKDAASDLGLELDFGSEKGVTMFAPTEDGKAEISSPPKLTINIVNGEALAKFLKKIDKVDLEKHPDLKEDILTIITNASRQIDDSGPSEEKMASLLAAGNKILHEFERLGFGKNTENLAENLINANGKTLNEFRSLKNAQCFDDPGAKTFGPSQWQRDISPSDYKNRWAKTKEAVLQSLQNKNAAALAKRAVENLIACADYAIKDMEIEMKDKKAGLSPYYKKVFPDLLKTAEKYKAEYQAMLSNMEEPEIN